MRTLRLRLMDGHRRLVAWQACRELTREVYRFTGAFPASERFGVSAQLRRAAVSATSNIAEGFARTGPRETAHALSITLGSLAEIDTLLAICEDLRYLSAEQVEHLQALRRRASQLVFGLLRKLRAKFAA